MAATGRYSGAAPVEVKVSYTSVGRKEWIRKK
jgi:hypothetical protein